MFFCWSLLFVFTFYVVKLPVNCHYVIRKLVNLNISTWVLPKIWEKPQIIHIK